MSPLESLHRTEPKLTQGIIFHGVDSHLGFSHSCIYFPIQTLAFLKLSVINHFETIHHFGAIIVGVSRS